MPQRGTNTLFLNEAVLLKATDARVVNDHRWRQIAARLGVDYNRRRKRLFDGSVYVILVSRPPRVVLGEYVHSQQAVLVTLW